MIKKSLIAFIALGSMAHQIHADKAYVSCRNTVSIFNTVTNTVSGTVIDTGSTIIDSSYIAFTPDGKTAYVANNNNPAFDSISIINVADNTVSGVVDMGTANFTSIQSLGITPDRTKMYVVDSGTNNVGIVDLTVTPNTYINNVTIGAFPFKAPNSIAITPDGTKAYVTNSGTGGTGANQVSVIDVENNTVIGYVADPGSTFNIPCVVTMSPDGTTAYVGNKGTALTGTTINTDSIINVPTDISLGTVTGSIGGISVPSIFQPIGLIVSPDGKTLYILNNVVNGIITVWDITNSSVITTIPTLVGSITYRFAITSNGKNLYATNVTPDTVSIISATTNTITGDVTDLNPPTFIDPFAIAIVPELAGTPSSASGLQVANIFLTETEFVNVLNWTAASGSPVSYSIYRDAALTNLAGAVSANTLTFQDHDQPNSSATYYIVSVDQYGAVSLPVVVAVQAV